MKWLLHIGCASVAALLLVACDSATPSPTPVRGGPYLTVAPSSGPQGSTFTLAGANWQPHSRVTLTLNPAVAASGNATISLGATTVDDQGHMNFVTIVPQAAAPGIWSIMARADASSQQATTAFAVTLTDATGTASPDLLPPAATEQPLPPATEQPLPTATPLPPASATPAPSVTAAPVSQGQPSLAGALQGNRLDLRGTGWNAGQNVNISASKDVTGKGAMSLGQAQVDDQGRFIFSVKWPKQARNASYLIVTDDDHRVVARIAKNGGN